MHNSQEVANLIKKLAKQKKIAVGKMLSDCQLSVNTLSSMQSGGYYPRVEAISKIADYLDCSVDCLLGRSERYYFTNTISQKENIMNRIKELRKANDISVERLAEIISVDVAELERYEANELQPTIEVFGSISKALQASIDYLAGYGFESSEISNARKIVNEWLNTTDTNILKIQNSVKCNYATIKAWSRGYGDYFNDKLYLLSKLIGLSVEEIVGNYSFSNGEVAAFGAKFSEIQNSIDEETTE